MVRFPFLSCSWTTGNTQAQRKYSWSGFPFCPGTGIQAQYNTAGFLSCPGTGIQAADRHSTIQQISHPVLVLGQRQQTDTETEQQFSHSVVIHGTQESDRHRDSKAGFPFHHGTATQATDRHRDSTVGFPFYPGTGTQAADRHRGSTVGQVSLSVLVLGHRHSTIQQVSLPVLVLGHRQQTGTVQQVPHSIMVLGHRQQTGTVQYSRLPFLSWYWDTGSRPAQYNTAGFPSCPGTGTQAADMHSTIQQVFLPVLVLGYRQQTDIEVVHLVRFPMPMPMPHVPNKTVPPKINCKLTCNLKRKGKIKDFAAL